MPALAVSCHLRSQACLMMYESRIYAAALALTEGVGWVLLGRLLRRFGSLAEICSATPEQLREVRGVGPKLSARIAQADPDACEALLRRCAADGITAITWLDLGYPPHLTKLPDRPLVLFFRGNYVPDPAHSVAIVGTRQPDRASIERASAWAITLARAGDTIVSGLARGIDTAAHSGAIAAGGRTLAILGGGVERLYPPENKQLAALIQNAGGLMSESHPRAAVSSERLVMRNRLIAALSRAVLVMEAGPKSGALYAARRAHELGIPVYAAPVGEGNLALLRDYALPLPEEPCPLPLL